MKRLSRKFCNSLLCFSLVLLNLSCSLFGAGREEVIDSQVVEAQQARQLARTQFQKGYDEYTKGKYLTSIELFEHYLSAHPSGADYLQARYFLGRSLEGLQRWQEASEQYRAIINSVPGQEGRFKAEALYRLSFCYEALKKDGQVIGTLLDALAHEDELPIELGKAEIPARLAGSYARTGNGQMADVYYSKAEAGLKLLKTYVNERPPEWLSQTLYNMGYMSLRKISVDQFGEDLKPLTRSQRFLIRAVEINHPQWGPLASEELLRIYDSALGMLEKVPLAQELDEVAAARQRQQLQTQMAASLLAMIEDLRINSLPPHAVSNSELVKVNQFVDQKKQKLEAFLRERTIGGDLTPEAQMRQKRLLKLKTIEPDDTLEKLARERAAKKLGNTQKKNHKLKQNPSSPDPVAGAEDPNLK